MYRLGHRIKRHHLIYIIFSLFIVCLLIVIVAISRHILAPNTKLKQSSGVTSYYSVGSTTTQFVSEPDFTIELPSGWYHFPDPSSPYKEYSWQGTGSDVDRHLDVYLDNVPTNMAVNHLLPVQTIGDHINVIGNVSDNCTNFTAASTEDAATGTASAKWDGVSFICDMANYERDVVAIGSAEGINSVTVVGSNNVRHQVLIVYTDNSSDPDYSIFDTIVQSFRLQ